MVVVSTLEGGMNPERSSHFSLREEMLRDTNGRTKTVKLIEENIRGILCDLALGKPLDMTPNVQRTKEKNR